MNFLTILGFIKKEFKQSLRDKKTKILIFGAPIIQLTIFGFAISNEVKNQKLFIDNPKNDYYISQIAKHAYSTNIFIKAKNEEEASAIIKFKYNSLSKGLSKNENNIIELKINAVNSVIAKSNEFYLKQIINKVIYNENRIQIGSQGQPSNIATATITPEIKILYNPEMVTSFYMIPGVMCMILCLVTIILTSMSIAKESELGTLEMILSTHIKPSELVLGKLVPYMILGIIDVILITIFSMLLFSLPFKGSLIIFLALSIIFILSTVSIGLMISSIASNQQQAMLGSFIFMMPAVLLSGLMFPIENMPNIIQKVTIMNPLRYFAVILRTLFLKGNNSEVIIFSGLILSILAMIAITISYNRFRKVL